MISFQVTEFYSVLNKLNKKVNYLLVVFLFLASICTTVNVKWNESWSKTLTVQGNEKWLNFILDNEVKF